MGVAALWALLAPAACSLITAGELSNKPEERAASGSVTTGAGGDGAGGDTTSSGTAGGIGGAGGATSSSSSAGGATSSSSSAGGATSSSSSGTGGSGGCTTDLDCTTPGATCDRMSGACVGCMNDDACPLGMICEEGDGTCVSGCTAMHGCAGGETCCGGLCRNTADDVANCGGCGVVCAPKNATGSCVGGACTIAACAAGHDDCNGMVGDGCEVDLTADPAHCGGCKAACSYPNASGSCAVSQCAMGACAGGYADCNGKVGDGCEAHLATDPLHCGGCGSACSLPNAVAGCSGGSCTIAACLAGFGDCDPDVENGCETQTSGSPVHCGACGTACNNINGTAMCTQGACVMTCSAGFSDCNGVGADGCEVDVTTDEANCGACGSPCFAGRTCSQGACTPSAVAMSSNGAPEPREMALGVWAGSALFVWGGRSAASVDLASGGLYDPSTDLWSAVSMVGMPSPRVLASGVWTGSRVIVWGGGPGGAGTSGLATGGRYVTSTGTWLSMSTVNAPSPRRAPIAVWTGSRMIVWGGVDSGAPVADGGRYDDAADAWSGMSGAFAPGPRTGYAWAWTGTKLLVFGGQPSGVGASDEGFSYDPAADAWKAMSKLGAPSARYDAFGAWAGGHFVIWGGRDAGGGPLDTGAKYDPELDQWSAIAMNGNPNKRSAAARRSGWAGGTATKALFVGGLDTAQKVKQDMGLHTLGSPGSWVTQPWPSSDHEWGVGVWSGHELILWSGRDAGALVASGERYRP